MPSKNREPIRTRVIRDRHGMPRIIVENFPGLYAEFHPDELWLMAVALLKAANDAGTTAYHCPCQNESPLKQLTP